MEGSNVISYNIVKCFKVVKYGMVLPSTAIIQSTEKISIRIANLQVLSLKNVKILLDILSSTVWTYVLVLQSTYITKR